MVKSHELLVHIELQITTCVHIEPQGSLSRGEPCLFSTRSIFSTHEKKQVSIRPGVNVPGAYLCRSIDRSAFVYPVKDDFFDDKLVQRQLVYT